MTAEQSQPEKKQQINPEEELNKGKVLQVQTPDPCIIATVRMLSPNNYRISVIRKPKVDLSHEEFLRRISLLGGLNQIANDVLISLGLTQNKKIAETTFQGSGRIRPNDKQSQDLIDKAFGKKESLFDKVFGHRRRH